METYRQEGRKNQVFFLVVVDAVAVPVVIHNIFVAVAAAVLPESTPRCTKTIAMVVHGIAEEPGQQIHEDIYTYVKASQSRGGQRAQTKEGFRFIH